MKAQLTLLKFTFLAAFMLILTQLHAQENPNQLLVGVREKLMKVSDYSVEVTIKAEIPLIKILPVKAKIYFKQPDKLKLVSKSIAILPKQGFGDYPNIIADSNSYHAFSSGTETIGNLTTQMINLIPISDTGDLILAKFWIDTHNYLIIKSQLSSRTNGTMTVQYHYGEFSGFGLPDNIVFNVDTKKFKIPKVLTSDPYADDKEQKPNTKTSNKGIIEINLYNYDINAGLDDSFFKKE